MLTLVMMLTLAQVGATDAPVKDSQANGDSSLTPPPSPPPVASDVPHANAPKRSAGLFKEARVETGVLVGRMGMGLLFGGLGSGVGGALVLFGSLLLGLGGGGVGLVIFVLADVLAVGLVGLGTALGAAMFGNDYGHDFLDALVVSMVSAVAAGLLLLVGVFVPALLWPMVLLAGGLMVAGVPLFVQAFKAKDDGPEATVALLHF
jgi:hypothetical protein